MAKGKKTDDKPKEGATLSIDVDSFVRTRDSVRLPPSPSFLLIPPRRGAYNIFNLRASSFDISHHNPVTYPTHISTTILRTTSVASNLTSSYLRDPIPT
jgi:hypothetical protein